ncbi:TPA: hypothetical protein JBB06_11570 [Legionella pneumophila subsp. pneumophila]|nr:hypothetical protein D7216_13425 [Legionella pneumophila]HAT8940143.1 hypothetical protein [Legionella pneumophila subsp. pneumophila]RYW85448.1 hypothetical protein D7221_14220 [Legionella pneumophila]HAT9030090.1 hypothetical protein [Legionella pneumophila subsp. pneumophila]HAU0126049.1 hypothetical protein [Legionella pneumophila]
MTWLGNAKDKKMIKIFIYLGLLLSSNLLMAKPLSQLDSANLAPCFNIEQAERIGKQINKLLQHEFCEENINPKKFASISHNILPKIMTETFLGVTPPENWQQLSNDIIKNCITNKNLCKKAARKELEECIKPKIPLILIQFGPWFAQNCPQLNKSLIEQWPNKQTILKKIINENKSVE